MTIKRTNIEWEIFCKLDPQSVPKPLIEKLENRDIKSYIICDLDTERLFCGGEDKGVFKYRLYLTFEYNKDHHAQLVSEIM